MDLSTTTKIKRRVVEFVPIQNQETTDCTITLANWFNNKSIEDSKFRVSFFYLNNTTIPCFIGKYISAFPTNPTTLPINLAGSNAGGFPMNTQISATSLDYWINIYDTNTSTAYCFYINMEDAYSKYSASKPVTHASSPFNQYKNNYFWFFNTSFFCELLTAKIKYLMGAAGINVAYFDNVDIVRTSNGYVLYMDNQFFTDGYELQFSQSLIDLFQFRNLVSGNSSFLFSIIPNTQTVTYNLFTAAKVASNYVPDTWFPFDRLIIRTDAPIESEVFYDNTNYISQNYRNIIMTYSLSNNNPDGIYNFYISKFNPDEGWCSLVNGANRENITFEILLRIRETKELISYTIGRGENATFTTETIDTI